MDECEDEDDEAQEFFSKKRADYPFKSKALQPNPSEEAKASAPAEESKAALANAKQASTAGECIGELSDIDSETHEVATGEQEGADEKTDATEREIWRKLE